MVYRVHSNTSYMRPLAEPAVSPGLSDSDILILSVSDLADCGHALCRYKSHFRRGQLKLTKLSVLRNKLGICSGASGNLTALSGP